MCKSPCQECVDWPENSQEVLEWWRRKPCERTDLGRAVSLHAGDCRSPWNKDGGTTWLP